MRARARVRTVHSHLNNKNGNNRITMRNEILRRKRRKYKEMNKTTKFHKHKHIKFESEI